MMIRCQREFSANEQVCVQIQGNVGTPFIRQSCERCKCCHSYIAIRGHIGLELLPFGLTKPMPNIFVGGENNKVNTYLFRGDAKHQ